MDFKKSLQAIKKNRIKSEALFKLLQQSHPHLACFSEEQILNYFNVNTVDELHEHLQGIKEFQYNRKTEKIEICSCRDSHGEIKNLYETEASAQAEADTLFGHNRLKLSVYRCPHGCGWHLTKR